MSSYDEGKCKHCGRPISWYEDLCVFCQLLLFYEWKSK